MCISRKCLNRESILRMPKVCWDSECCVQISSNVLKTGTFHDKNECQRFKKYRSSVRAWNAGSAHQQLDGTEICSLKRMLGIPWIEHKELLEKTDTKRTFIRDIRKRQLQ